MSFPVYIFYNKIESQNGETTICLLAHVPSYFKIMYLNSTGGKLCLIATYLVNRFLFRVLEF